MPRLPEDTSNFKKHILQKGSKELVIDMSGGGLKPSASRVLASSCDEQRRPDGHGDGMQCRFLKLSGPNGEYRQNMLDRHCSVADGIFGDHQPLDPLVREDHICWPTTSSLQQQRPSDDKLATKNHGRVRGMVQNPLRYGPGSAETPPSFQGVSALHFG